MLQLILGPAGSGKSAHCLARIEALAAEGKRSVLVVPEQSSFSFERALTLRLSPQAAAFVQVRSFRSLCGDIFALAGGGARKHADDALRAALVRRAMQSLGDGVTCFRRHRNDVSFFALASSVIDELKNAGVSPQRLREVAGSAASPLSQARLGELSDIYAVYDDLLEARYQDNASEAETAAVRLLTTDHCRDTVFFVDGYTGFTEPQFKLLRALMRQAKEVAVTLCCDGLAERDDVFATVRTTGHRLLDFAERDDGTAVPPVVLTDTPRFQNAGLAALERFLAAEQLPDDNTAAPGVTMLWGSDRYDEIRRVADEIVALVREQGYRFSDIVVVSRDSETYRAAVTRTFTQFGIPCFSDSTRSLRYTPMTVFLLSLLEMANGIRSDSVLNLLKTGLTTFDIDAVGLLENYLFVWNIDRAAWYKPFTGNPDGFSDATDASSALLAQIERMRTEILGWLSPVADAARNHDSAALIRALYETAKRSGALKALEERGGDEAREGSAALAMLDNMYTLLDGDPLSPQELIDLFSLLAAATPLGDIPPTLEQVAVGTADRIRTDNPRAVFAIGLNEGVFPRAAYESPLFTGAERDLLTDHNISLTRSYFHTAAMEQLYLYRTLATARERLYLCGSEHDTAGNLLQPSAKIAVFAERFALDPALGENDPARFIVNEQTAAVRYADALSEGDRALTGDIAASVCGGCAGAVEDAARPPRFMLKNGDALLPSGRPMTLSASRIETFSRCHFRYFVQYTLGIRPLKKAEISPIEAGNFVHYILENALRRFVDTLPDCTEADLKDIVACCTDDYIAEKMGPDALASARMRYLLERLKAQAVRLLLHLQDEQRQSAFLPVDYELDIAEGGDIAPMVLDTPDGRQVSVVGKVDRVDVLKKDGSSYLRVIDYKTGAKTFSMTDVYYGLSAQMFLYLFTLTQNGGERYRNPVSAGVLYLPADPSPPTERTAAKTIFRMDGVIIDDIDVVKAMEREVAGIFIPVAYNSSGALSSKRLLSLERLGQIQRHIERLVVDIASALYRGDIDALPILHDNKIACDICDYAAVCRHDRDGRELELADFKNDDPFAVAPAGEEVGGDEMDA